MIYMDYAATAPLRSEALKEMIPFMQEEFSNASGAYASARRSRSAIDKARKQVAAAIGAKVSEIYFTSCGSEADNWAIFGTAKAYPERKHIITTQIEHHAMLHACRALEAQGYEITYLDADEQALISPESVLAAIRPDTLLVSVMLANNEIGTLEPVSEIAKIAHRYGILMHTDAVQAVGHIPIDVDALGVDFLSMSAHKFGGPKGIGALYIRESARIENMIYGGAQERGLRAGTENTPAIVGMGAALELSVREMEENAHSLSALRDDLQNKLLTISGIEVHAANTARLPGHLHISIEGANTQLLLMRLDMAGIACSGGSACASGAAEHSHVIQAMGLADENRANIRFSLGRQTTAEECDAVFAVLKSILKR